MAWQPLPADGPQGKPQATRVIQFEPSQATARPVQPCFRRLVQAAATMVLSLTAVCSGAAEDPAVNLRAAFLYRMAYFVQWPSRSFADDADPVKICVDGRDVRPIAVVLQSQVKGRRVAGRNMVVHSFAKEDDLTGCHLVFLVRLPAIDQPLPEFDRSTVVVVDSLEHLRRTGVLALVMEAQGDGTARMVIYADLKRSRSLDATLSSKLLQLTRSAP